MLVRSTSTVLYLHRTEVVAKCFRKEKRSFRSNIIKIGLNNLMLLGIGSPNISDTVQCSPVVLCLAS